MNKIIKRVPLWGEKTFWRGIISIMRIFILFICIGLSSVYANLTNAQTKIDINVTGVTFEELFKEIQSKSEFVFFYKDDVLNSKKKISIHLKNAIVATILDNAFLNTDLDYKIDDRQVVVKKKIVSVQPVTLTNYTKLQGFSISGTITDNTGVPLPGASIVEKGTTNGTQSDFDGNFSMTVENGNSGLTISYIGFATKEIAINGQEVVNVSLEESSSGLEEVVVVGYGTQAKKDITGSVSVVDGDEIAARSTTNVSNALQGSVAGVSVTRSNSEPGAGNEVRVRGVTTLQGNSSPLILVDDVPVSSINDVNPDQIESISVLKDGASAAIYGSRAAAGVIIITTKRGKSEVFNLGYSGEYFINTPTETRKTVAAIPYMQMDNEKAWNDNGNDGNEYPTWSEELISNYTANNAINPDQYPDTNWRDLILRKSSSGYRHNINISGGSEKVRTNASFGYEYQDALYAYRDWKRYNARINNDIKISNKLGATLDFAMRLTKDDRPTADPTARAIQSAPVYAAIWADGRIGESKSGDNMYAQLHQGGYQTNENYLFYGKVGLFYKPNDALKISVNLAPNFEFNKYKFFNKSIPYWGFDDPNQLANPNYISGHNSTQTYLIERRANDNTITTQALVNYEESFGNHNISGVIGYEEFSSQSETLGVRGNEFVSSDYPFLNQAPIDKVFDSGTGVSENAYSSYFGRVAYNFNNKYYLQGTVRRDGSSRFGKDYRWGSFPSVSGGWVVSNENFMEALDPAISFLKLRASYGSLGNDRLGNYLYLSVLQFSNALIANGGNVQAVRSAAQRFLAIEDVTWETTTTLDLGIDLNLFNDRLSITADYFKKDTRDMLLDLSIPALSGYDDPTVNVGGMDTKGWELGLTYRQSIGDVRLTTSFNIFDSKSIIGNVSGKRLFDGNFLSEEGTEFRSWYGYQSDGLYQTQAEVDNSATTSDAVSPGDIKYKDISGPDGTPDGVINELDKTILGGSLPRYQYGGNLNLAYKRFDFGVVFQGVGQQSFNLSSNFIRPFQESWLSPSTLYAGNYWSAYNSPDENLKAAYPRLSENAVGNNYNSFSDYWLINGSYLRVKNITLGYTLPSEIFGENGFSALRLYVAGNDLFTVDRLPEGIDPEQGSGYLITKSFIVGVKANF
ncbi:MULTISPECIES: TonB-dependent receptor [unclassified Arenibacter]|uniref:TonB-dependent receptor n=1 Tax=unclassified Arenibacter TaxID=2615047 RepID=UPI000E34B4FF|nr:MULTISPECIES: TonB-dependent receptor [unclassified Arenibacter]MCM4162319.1 SusC/RagA family TonB-linked outer membrane protein [Arenibacter sp. A80]RFT57920.1 SusC/RagA family TonB-linked outer membrane protein [Arenibacter sp. P308M17]